MALLEQNITRKKQVNKLLELKLVPDIGQNKEYEFEAIKDSAVYIEVAEVQLLGLYYLVS